MLLEELKSNGGLSNGHLEEVQDWPIVAEIAALGRELAAAKETITEREEEVQELKAERANMKVFFHPCITVLGACAQMHGLGHSIQYAGRGNWPVQALFAQPFVETDLLLLFQHIYCGALSHNQWQGTITNNYCVFHCLYPYFPKLPQQVEHVQYM